MNNAANAANTSTPLRQRTPDMTIDWEFQPSLQHLVKRADAGPPEAATWAETMPMPLESLQEPVTFQEPLQGLSMRDIDEPEIFRVLFGESAAAGLRA